MRVPRCTSKYIKVYVLYTSLHFMRTRVIYASLCLFAHTICGQKGSNIRKGVLDSERIKKQKATQLSSVYSWHGSNWWGEICCDKGHKEGEGSTSTFSEHLFIPMSLRPKYVAVDMDVSQGGGGIGGGKHWLMGKYIANSHPQLSEILRSGIFCGFDRISKRERIVIVQWWCGVSEAAHIDCEGVRSADPRGHTTTHCF